MILEEADLRFNFTDAQAAKKFDDHEHGLSYCMKAVDFIVELENDFLFIEIKDPSNPKAREKDRKKFIDKAIDGGLKDEIVKKFRDSFIYRYSENKLNKPIHYISVVTIEEALLNSLQDDIQKHLPFSGSPEAWLKPLVKNCLVMSIATWNRNFTKWPLTRISQLEAIGE